MGWDYACRFVAMRIPKDEDSKGNQAQLELLKGIMDNTIRIARLKLLHIAAKIRAHSGTTTVKYSRHDSRVAGSFRFLEYLDRLRNQTRPWLDGSRWPCRHLAALNIS